MIIKKQLKVFSVNRLVMKIGSNTFRQSSVHGIIKRLKTRDIKVIDYESKMSEGIFFNSCVENGLEIFNTKLDLIVTNRMLSDPKDISDKVFTRDLCGCD